MYLTHDSTFVSLYFFLNDGNEIIKRRFDRKRAYIKTQSTREKFLYKLDPTDTRLPNSYNKQTKATYPFVQ